MGEPKEILLRRNKDGTWEEYKEPYATIECETEEDFHHLEEIVEFYRKYGKWAPITEDKPKAGEEVLVWVKCPQTPGMHMDIYTYDPDLYQPQWDLVTHWLPRPEPPEGMEGVE